MASPERRLAAILFSDIVGYTTLMASDEAAGLRARERHRSLLGVQASRYHGEVVDENGDELVLCFPSAVEAVNCALAAQAELVDHEAFQLRIGIHLGDVVFEEGRVYGDGVNVASRVRPHAEPGGVCVSEPVYDSVKNQVNVEATSLGAQEFKNVARPVEVFALRGSAAEPAIGPTHTGRRSALFAVAAVVAVALVGIAAWLTQRPRPASEDVPVLALPTGPTVAVLPFTNMSSDAEKEFLADGLTEDIITLLAQSSGVEVVARNSTFKYKGTNPDIRAVGLDLGADYVVEGSLRPMGERIRVTVQVIDSHSGAHAWARKYDRAVSAFFDVQDEVTLGIAAAVGDAVFREEYSRVSQSRTDDLNAWALTSRAEVAHHLRFTGTESIELARQAVAADPRYARAHAVLGRSLVVKGLFGDGTQADIVEGESAARHAAVLAPDDPRVVALLAISLMWAGKPEEALPHAKRAVDLSPSYAEGLGYLGDILIHNGRSRDALPYHDKALRLTPESSQRFFYLISKGEALIHHGAYEAAERTLASVQAIGALQFMYLSGAQLMQGKTGQARASLTRAVELEPERTVAREAEIMAYYSTDEGGPHFKEVWSRLSALEAELPEAR